MNKNIEANDLEICAKVTKHCFLLMLDRLDQRFSLLSSFLVPICSR